VDLLFLNPIAHKAENKVHQRVYGVIVAFYPIRVGSCVMSCSQPIRGNLMMPILMYRAATRSRARLSLSGCMAGTLNARRSISSIAAA
jgi:hypothetical protein